MFLKTMWLLRKHAIQFNSCKSIQLCLPFIPEFIAHEALLCTPSLMIFIQRIGEDIDAQRGKVTS